MSELEKFFESRETRMNALGEKSKARLSEVMTGSTDPEAEADKFFSSAWLSERTGKPHDEILQNWELERATYWGADASDKSAYDSVSTYYQENKVPRGTQNNFIDAGRSLFGGAVETALAFSAGAYQQLAYLDARQRVTTPEGRKRQMEIQKEIKTLTRSKQAPRFIKPMKGFEEELKGMEFMSDADRSRAVELHDELSALLGVREKKLNAEVANSIFKGFADEARSMKKGFQEWNTIDQEFKESLTGKVTHGFGQLGFYIPAAMVPYIGSVAIQSTMFEEGYQDAMKSDASESEAFEAAFTSSIVNTFLERAGINTIVGKLFKTVGKAGKMSYTEILKSMTKTGFKSSIAEGTTEALQGAMLDWVAQNSYDEGRELLSEESLKSRFEEFVVGAIVGGGAGSLFQGGSDLVDNRAKGKLIKAKDGKPLTTEEFAFSRESMTDEIIRRRMPEHADLYIEAINGDRKSQIAYNSLVSPNTDLPGMELVDRVSKTALYKDGEDLYLVNTPQEGAVRVASIDAGTPEGGQFLEQFNRLRELGDLQELSGVDVFEQGEMENLHATVADMPGAPSAVLKDGKWKILLPDGEQMGEADTKEQAIAEMTKWAFSSEKRAEAAQVAETIGYFESVLDGSRTFENLTSEKTSLLDWHNKGMVSWATVEGAVRAIRPMDDSAVTASDAANIQIFGNNQIEGAGKFIRDVSYIFQGGTPLTVVEETTEGYIKRALRDGSVSLEQLFEWKAAWEEFTGEVKYADGERGAIELFSDLAIDYVLTDGGTVRDAAESTMLETLLPSWFESFVRKLKLYYSALLNHAVHLVNLKEQGELTEDLEMHLRRSLGLDRVFNEERNQAAEREEIVRQIGRDPDMELSKVLKGKLPHPSVAEANGDQMAADLREVYENLVAESLVRKRARRGDSSAPVVGVSKRRNVAKANAFFSKTEKRNLDTIRDELADDGFNFETVDEMLEALKSSLAGNEIYPDFSSGSTFSSYWESGYLKDPDLTAEEKKQILQAKIAWFDKYQTQTPFVTSRPFPGINLDRDATAAEKMARLQEKMDSIFGENTGKEFFDDTGSTFQAAYHGSGVRFDRFSTQFINTGEGAQAYGWGLYFTDTKSVAEFYKNTVGGDRRTLVYKGKKLPMVADNPIQQYEFAARHMLDTYVQVGYSVAEAFPLAAAKFQISQAKAEPGSAMESFWRQTEKAFQKMRIDDFSIEVSEGTGYQVDLKPEPHEYLLWDEILDDQSPYIQRIFDNTELDSWLDELESQMAFTGENITGENLYRFMTRELSSQKEASKILNSMGIRGIKFKDQLSRRGASESTYNYVIFDERDVEIESTFSLEDGKNLLGVHNTSEKKLSHIQQMSGMAAPSLAVINTKNSNFIAFGDITLIADPDLVNPQSNKVQVFDSDYYSPRYPSLKHFITREKQREIREWMTERLPGKSSSPAYSYLASIEADGLYEGAYRSDGWKYIYLNENGLLTDEIKDEYAAARLFTYYPEKPTDIPMSEFQAWVDKKLDSLGAVVTSKIFKGFTRMGQRSYTAHTLENVVKILTKKVRNGEGFNYGPGSIRSVVAKKYRNIGQMKNDRDRIISTEDMEAVESESSRKLEELSDLAGRNLFDFADDMIAFAERDLDYLRNVREFSDTVLAEMSEYLNWLKGLPTEYFEVKVGRAVDISEFRAAVVPKEIGDRARDYLKRNNLKVFEYDPAVKGSLKQAVLDAGQSVDSTFSLDPDPAKSVPPPPENYGIEKIDELFERYHQIQSTREAEKQRAEEEKALAEGRTPLKSDRSVLSYIGLPISSDLRRVAPGVFAKVREYSNRLNIDVQSYQTRTMPFRKAVRSLSKEKQTEVALALANSNYRKVKSLLNNDEAVQEVQNVLNEVRKEALAAGYEVEYRKNYFPRWVKDLDGLMESFGMERHGLIRQALFKAESEVGILSEQQRIMIVNQAIRGLNTLGASNPGNFNEREIEQLTPEQLEKFYGHPFDALDRYISSVMQGIAQKQFFGQLTVWEEVGFENLVMEGLEDQASQKPLKLKRVDLEKSVGALVLSEMQKGHLSTASEEKAMVDALRAFFEYQATPANWNAVRALGYATTLGTGIGSTITQLTDVAFARFEAGGIRAGFSYFAAVFGISEVKIERDLGMGNLSIEYQDMMSGSKMLDKLFTVTGLKHFGRAGQNTLVNAGIGAYRREARKGKWSPRRQVRLNEYFANDQNRIAKLRNDLAEGKTSEDVLLLGWNILADYHPVDMSEMPRGYLNHPRLRIAYMLKTFTMKQFDAYRREGIVEITEGIRQKDWKRTANGFKGLVNLMLGLWMAGVPVDWLKDWIFGRNPNFPDLAVDNLFKLMGWSRYNQYYARQYGMRQALLVAMNPPMPFVDYPFRDIGNLLDEDKEFNLEDAETWRLIPVVGQFYYWLIGGGETKMENERQAERRKKVNQRANQ